MVMVSLVLMHWPIYSENISFLYTYTQSVIREKYLKSLILFLNRLFPQRFDERAVSRIVIIPRRANWYFVISALIKSHT